MNANARSLSHDLIKSRGLSRGICRAGYKGRAKGIALFLRASAAFLAGVNFVLVNAAPSNDLPTQHDVIPILLRHCASCHGGTQQEAGLDLHSINSMMKGGKSGASLIPGSPDESIIVRRIRSGDCPPKKRLVEASVKPVEAFEFKKLVDWIAAGAPVALDEPELAGTPNDPLVRDKQREFWSFRPPKYVPPPPVHGAKLVHNPIDAFILSKLEGKNLSFAPEAPKAVLLRRVCFDLTGLPPSPDEVETFLSDTDDRAYERLIDRLLDSPRYGERWGRYWLDLAGYSDVEGRREQHLPRSFAYRYRDYVIQSFNADKPYDRFLLEQIAGDELANYENAPEISREVYDNLVATGFLRMGPDPTWANITGFVPDRLEVMADAIDIFGSVVLGLTLKCARCHDHKFDPIPQRDYYRLIDLFKGAYDEYDWLKPDLRPFGGAVNIGNLKERSLPFVLPEERKAWEAQCKEIDRQLAARNSELNEEETRLRGKYREAELAKLGEDVRENVRAMLATPVTNRTLPQQELAALYEKKLTPDREELKKFDAPFKKRCDDVAALKNKKPLEPRIAALWDRGQPSPTYIYRRGDSQRPGPLVKAGVPSVLIDGRTPFEVRPPWPGTKKTGRRLALARWLTQPDHPLTSRVMVNRIWKQHFGQGIVKSLGNFGKMGAAPSHPELLDWLACEFVRSGWRIKHLQRLILNSRTYRQSSIVSANQIESDPENALLSRMPLKRIEAEALWDSYLFVAGSLDETRFGPPVPVQSRGNGVVMPGKSGQGWRRSIYGQQLRKDAPTLLEIFDLPSMNPNCLERSESIVAPQALHLLNDTNVRELAALFARRVRNEAGPDPKRQIQLAFLIARARAPSAQEKEIGSSLVNELSSRQILTLEAPTASTSETSRDAESRNLRALTTLCHALMNSAEFLYVD